MYRYGSSGVSGGGRRRRSHRLRNSLIGLLALLLAGTAFAATPPGRDVLDRVGVLKKDTPTVANNPDASPTTSATAAVAGVRATATPAGDGDPTAASTPQPGQTNTSAPDATATQPEGPPTAPPIVPTGGNPQPTATGGVLVGQPTPLAATATVPPLPTGTTVPAADPLDTANAFLRNWQAGRYAEMYKVVSEASVIKAAGGRPPRDYFLDRYGKITERATITSVEPKLKPEAANEAKRQELLLRLPISVKMQTRQVGEIVEDNILTLVKEDDLWRVQWAPSLIFKDLADPSHLIDLNKIQSPRGAIYDRAGKPLAVEGSIITVGVVPSKIKNENEVLTRLSAATGIPRQDIQASYKGGNPEWFYDVQSLTKERATQLQASLANLEGVDFQARAGREYPQGRVLSQILGWVGPIFADDLKKPEYAGYSETDLIGRDGLEKWGEQYLRGRPGGELFVKTADEVKVKTIKEQKAQKGADIYLNIDLALQAKADQELNVRKLWGSIVAIDPNNGEILAAASAPTFDPNEFVIGISDARYRQLTDPKNGNPFQNRATNSAYPMASTFKPITMAAALTYPLPDIDTKTWYDTGTWNRDGTQRGDWKPGGHGYIQLIDALIQSCDIVFYDLGYELWRKDPAYLSDFAKKWGLGASPDIAGVYQTAGLVPGPGNPTPLWNPGDNVNLAIGQGYLQASPVQAANVYATFANGGTVYQPRLVNRVVAADGKVLQNYPKKVMGKVPVNEKTMNRVKYGMELVANDPPGTAYSTFRDFSIKTAGKTGTGEEDMKKPLAWYAGYAPFEQAKVAVVAVAENAGQGSQIAAPIVREMFETYLRQSQARP